MRSLSRLALAVALCAGLAASAAGQSLAPVDAPEADVLPELLLLAKAPGPAWWRVSRGSSVVWIMGLPASPTPKGLAWDRKALDRRLTGAQALLVPAVISLSIRASGQDARAGGDIAARITPALAARFTRTREQIRKPARRYDGPIPAGAFFKLYEDYLVWAKLERGAVTRRVRAMAKARKVPVVTPEKLQAGQLTAAQADPNLPAAAACYGAVVEATEVSIGRYRMVADGWARGDLSTAILGPRHPYSICENRLFNEGASRRSINLQIAAIRAALVRPGKTVAVAELRHLLAEEGILARLKREGYEVMSPNEVESD